MSTFVYVYILIGIILQASFIYVEHKDQWVAADILKGLASLMFVLVGFSAGSASGNRIFQYGLLFGMIGDILLNLRFIFKQQGQKIFLAGILFFLIGHILYLVGLLPYAQHTLLCVVIGAVVAACLLAYIFKTMKVEKAFKIFGIFYLGAVFIMTAIAIGIAIFTPGKRAAIYAIGAVLFTLSDVILIFNTFSGTSRFSLRIANLSLYYIGQILIACSLHF